MQSAHRTLTVLAAGLLFVATVASAQQSTSSDRRSGRSIAVGLFASHYDLECTGCTSTGPDDPWRGTSGNSGFLAVGFALSHQLLIGGEVNMSGGESGERLVTITQVLLTAHYFPIASRGFHVTAGVGQAGFQIGGAGGGAATFGWAIRVGAGYDIAIGRRFALTPFASVARTSSGTNRLTSSGNAGPVTALRLKNNRTVTQYGLAIVYGGF